MQYRLSNFSATSVFMMPTKVADSIKIASKEQLEIIIYFFRHISEEITPENIAENLNLHISETEDALEFWVETGVLQKDGDEEKKETVKPSKKAKLSSIKPTREEIAKRSEDRQIQFLLREAQMKFARPLKQSEVSALIWLFDDEGLDVALILMLIEFAKSENKLNVRFIETTALDWINNGVTDIVSAENYIEEKIRFSLCFKTAAAAFGLAPRKPSKKEESLSAKWIDEWHFSKEMLEEAYDISINAAGNLSFSYIDKILEKWHKSGVAKKEDIPKKTEKADNKVKGVSSSYDKELLDKILNSDE